MLRRGEIYWADLNPVQGREQHGKRPVLVVSCDEINSKPLVVTVVPGIRAAHLLRDYRTNVRVSARESGLTEDTVFLCFQARALDPDRLHDPKTGEALRAGKLPPQRMAEVEAALRWVLRL